MLHTITGLLEVREWRFLKYELSFIGKCLVTVLNQQFYLHINRVVDYFTGILINYSKDEI